MKKITKIFASVFALLLVCVGAIGLVGCTESNENKKNDGLVIGGLTFKQTSISIPTKTSNPYLSNSVFDDYTRNYATVYIEYEISNNTEQVQMLKPILFKRDVQLFESYWDTREYTKTVGRTDEFYRKDDKSYTVEYVTIDYFYNPYEISSYQIESDYLSEEFLSKNIVIVPGESVDIRISCQILYQQTDVSLNWSSETGKQALKEAFEQITFNISYNNVNLASGKFVNFE